MVSRRAFIQTGALAFLGLQRYTSAAPSARIIEPLGPLLSDPAGIVDLPRGFSYRILAKPGGTMSDGFKVPGAPDGMAAFPTDDGKLVLVCNHELNADSARRGPFRKGGVLPPDFDRTLCYDAGGEGEMPMPGGTTNIVFDPETGTATAHFLSLVGTDRNCAGGAMPWGSWITCEEPGDLTSKRGLLHGWCFEVKATGQPGVQKPVPLKALGRFRHEAVACDPRTGSIYLTEDRNDGLLYRFVPEKAGDLTKGKLQALVIDG